MDDGPGELGRHRHHSTILGLRTSQVTLREMKVVEEFAGFDGACVQ
jgi:hypothetical protein